MLCSQSLAAFSLACCTRAHAHGHNVNLHSGMSGMFLCMCCISWVVRVQGEPSRSAERAMQLIQNVQPPTGISACAYCG